MKKEIRDNAKCIIQRAVEILSRPYAWVKFNNHSHKIVKGKTYDGYCAVGALNQARSELALSIEEKLVARRAVERAARTQPGTLESWNDRDDRTKTQVVTAFKRAVKTVDKIRSVPGVV